MRCRKSIGMAAAAALAWACGASEPGPKVEREEPENGDDRSEPGGLGMMGAMLAAQAGQPGPYDPPRQSEDYAEDEDHYAVLELKGAIVELKSMSLFSGAVGTELRLAVEALEALAAEEKVAGLILRAGDVSLDMTAAEGLRAALLEFKRPAGEAAGERERRVYCHIERAGDAVYYLLSACDAIGMTPTGGLSITGPAAVPIHIKRLLDRLGVQAQFQHIGAYKGAAEPLTRDRPSKEMIETLQAILDTEYATLVAGIAEGRGLSPARVEELIDQALFQDQEALAAALVNDIAPFEAFRDQRVEGLPWRLIRLQDDGAQEMSKLMEILGLRPRKRPTEPHVALVYAVGGVVEGEGQGPLGARSEIASRPLSSALRALARDDSVRAIVLRIDSGGGSALASEIIWQTVRDVKEQKPVVVSLGSVAASGGYYIASAGTKIYAARTTLTGSIGVVGGKLLVRDGLEKLGIGTFPMAKAERSLLWSGLSPWSERERIAVRGMMESIYDQFVDRVAESRSLPREEVEKLARGRVWTGKDALELKLVDEIGGLEDALAEARRLAEVPLLAPLEVYPPEPTLLDILESFSFGGGASLPGALTEAILLAEERLGKEAAAAVRSLLTELLRFQDHGIRAVTFLPAALGR